MVIDKNRIVIGLLLVLFFISGYYFKLDLVLLSLTTLFVIFELYKCKFIQNNYDYSIVILLFITFLFINGKYELLDILNFIFILFILIIIFFPSFYLKKFFFICVLIFIYNFFSLTFINRDLFYFTIFVSFLNDTIAYISGKILKGPLIVPNISPNKTWSGTLTSFILTTFVIYQYDYSIFISCLLSISLFFGDIFYSFIKRKNKLKDFSNLLQGHGGILDRIDSMFFFVIIINFNYI